MGGIVCSMTSKADMSQMGVEVKLLHLPQKVCFCVKHVMVFNVWRGKVVGDMRKGFGHCRE